MQFARASVFLSFIILCMGCSVYNNPNTGLQYDLSPLRQYTNDWYFQTPSDGDFFINFCAPTIQSCRGVSPDAVCNYKGPTVLESYNFGDVDSATYSPNGVLDGLIVTYTTSDTSCGVLQRPVYTQIRISCGSTRGRFTNYEVSGCNFNFWFSSIHGCGTNVHPSPSPLAPVRSSAPSASPLPSPIPPPKSPETLPKLPGVTKTGSGYNLLVESPASPLQIGSETLGQVFEDFTYNLNQTWTLPSGQRYAIPDQVHVSRAQSFGVKTYTYQSVGAYLDEQGDNIGLNLEYEFEVNVWGNLTCKIPVGANAVISQMNSKMKTAGSVLVVAAENIPLYDLQQYPGRTLSSQFVKAVQTLAQSLVSQTDLENFFKNYGTHVQSKVEMGGKLTLFDVVTGSQSGYATSTTIQAGLRMSFLSVTGSLTGWSGINKNTPASYSSGLGKYRVGGDTSLPYSSYSTWVKSVPDSPAVIGQQLSSIVPLMRSVSSRAADRYLDFLRDKFKSLDQPIYEAANNNPTLPYSWQAASYPNAAMTSISYFSDDDDDCQSCKWNVASSDGEPHSIRYAKPGMISWNSARTFGSTPYASSHFEEQEELVAQPSLRTTAVVQGNYQCGWYPCIPGLDTMGIGFDIVTGSPALPALQWTFNKGNTWKSPYTQEIYAYPDQVVLDSTSTSQMTTQLLTSYSDFCLNTSDASAPGWNRHFFQLGREAQSVRRAFDATQSVLGVVEESYVSYSLELAPYNMIASRQFNQSLQQLPRTYDADAYFRFLSEYGTHFSAYSSYGGKAKMYTFIDQNYFTSFSSNQIETMLGAQYAGWKGGIQWGSTSSSTTASFSSESFQWVSFFGGDATLALTSQWSEWIDTTHYSPAQVFKTLNPIWTLTSDSVLSSNIQHAVNQYYQKANSVHLPSPVYLSMSLQFTYSGQFISTYDQYCTFYHGFLDEDYERFPTSYKKVSWSFYAPAGYYVPSLETRHVASETCASTSGQVTCPTNSYIGGSMHYSSTNCGSCYNGLLAHVECYSLEIVT